MNRRHPAWHSVIRRRACSGRLYRLMSLYFDSTPLDEIITEIEAYPIGDTVQEELLDEEGNPCQ